MEQSPYLIEKHIEFDMGHRVPTHTSKCSNLHGHRYRVLAGCSAEQLVQEGGETGMVMDFGRIKHILTVYIHDLFDHRTCLWRGDALLPTLIPAVILRNAEDFFNSVLPDSKAMLADSKNSYYTVMGHNKQIYVLTLFIPTAEELAYFAYRRIRDVMIEAGDYNKGLKLEYVKIWETPTSVAQYPGVIRTARDI